MLELLKSEVDTSRTGKNQLRTIRHLLDKGWGLTFVNHQLNPHHGCHDQSCRLCDVISCFAAFRNVQIASFLSEDATRKYIGTHNSAFPCDEALAVSMLKLLPKFAARDEAKLAKCEAVVDVGGIYDPKMLRFDHHQHEIRGVMDALQFDVIASYFDKDDDEIDPYIVCEGVSVAAFNKYVGDGEGLRIPLRFLSLYDGRIVIVDLPTKVYESTTRCFEKMFNRASGNDREVASGGSMTARRAVNPKKEADATFGPMRSTLNRTPPPTRRTVADWVTLAVEVGRSQTWTNLEAAAQWWCNYSGIQYILLLKISPTCTQMRYALYDIATLGTLPAPTTSGAFRRLNVVQPPVHVSFDMRRILSIPANQALPPDVNPTAFVDLRIVMNLVIDSL